MARWRLGPRAFVTLSAKSPCTEKCGITDHKQLMVGGVFLWPKLLLSASIPAWFGMAVFDVEPVSRE